MAIVLKNGYLLEGNASVASKIDYTVSGLDGTSLTMLASGQLGDSKATLYTASGVDTIAGITLYNTHSAAVTANLYINDGTSRKVLGISLGIGYHALFNGNTLSVYDENGNVEVNQNALPHGNTHENGGDDEISVAGLSGTLADDQHIIDAEAVDAVEAAGLILADTKNIEYDPSPAGSHTANGKVVTLTAGASLVFGDACYMGTDGKMEKALADDAAITIPATHLCIATIAENDTGKFLEDGWAHDDSWAFDVGKSIYLSAATAGLITKTMPTKVTGNQVQVLGVCGEIADVIYWNPCPIIAEYA